MAFLAAIGPAVAGATSALSGISTAIGLLGTVVSAVGAISQANAQAKAMELQATNALIQGNAQAMNHQKQAIAVMNRTMETEAAINARGAAAGIDPFSGSAGALSDYALRIGFDEYSWARKNVEMDLLSGKAGQAAYQSAAESYRLQGFFAATTGLMSGFQKLSAIGGPTPVKPLGGAVNVSGLTPSPSLSGYPQYVTGTMY